MYWNEQTKTGVQNVNDDFYWYKNGLLHRLDGPAVIFKDGGYEWRIRGILHRSNNEPAVSYANGHKEWYIYGKLHNLNGPAVINIKGDVEYWEDGILLYKFNS